MSRTRMPKPEREARAILKSSGLLHECRLGKSHLKVFIQDKLAFVMSPSDAHTDLRMLESIIKKLKATPCN